MRLLRFSLPAFGLFCLSSVCLPRTEAQQAQPGTTTGTTQVLQDPQAVSVLTKALNTAGGAAAVGAIADYTASGNITYPSEKETAQGPVTVLGLGSNEFRLDANLPTGVRSWSVDNGLTTIKSEKGTISQLTVPSSVPSTYAVPYHTSMFPSGIGYPYRQLVTILNNQTLSITSSGTTQIEGHSVYDIIVRRTHSSRPDLSEGKEFFIDSSTFELFIVKDIVPRNLGHQIKYSDYRTVNGVLVPFSITEEAGGQAAAWLIQLTQISFNSGLQVSAFVIN